MDNSSKNSKKKLISDIEDKDPFSISENKNFETKNSFLIGEYFTNTILNMKYKIFILSNQSLYEFAYSIMVLFYFLSKLIFCFISERISIERRDMIIFFSIPNILVQLVSSYIFLKKSSTGFIKKNIFLILAFLSVISIHYLDLIIFYLNIKEKNTFIPESLFTRVFFICIIEIIGFQIYIFSYKWIIFILFFIPKVLFTFLFLNENDILVKEIKYGMIINFILHLFNILLKIVNSNRQLQSFIIHERFQITKDYFSGFVHEFNNPIISINNSNGKLSINKRFLHDFEAFLIGTNQSKDKFIENIISLMRNMKSEKLNKSLYSLLYNFNDNDNKKTSDTTLHFFMSSKTIREEENISKNNTPNNLFFSLGNFTISNENILKCYDISIRLFFIYNKFISIDIVFNDLTEVKATKEKETELHIKSTLFSKIAHEFKTPLITITSKLEDLEFELKSFFEKKKREDMKSNNIYTEINNIKHLAHYTNFLILDIIQYSSGSIENIKNKLNITIEKTNQIKNQIVEFCESILKSLIAYGTGNKKIIKTKIHFDKEINNYYIISDMVRLNQILLNFISNSVKFTKKGMIEMYFYLQKNEEHYKSNPFFQIKHSNEVDCLNKKDREKEKEKESILEVNHYNQPSPNNNNHIQFNINANHSIIVEHKPSTGEYYLNTFNKTYNDDQDYLIIHIKDTGLGMTHDTLNKLGNITLLNNKEYNNSMGSGLGIGISKSIANQLDIEIKIESIINEGTVFSIRIPIFKEENSIDNNIINANFSSKHLKGRFSFRDSEYLEYSKLSAINNKVIYKDEKRLSNKKRNPLNISNIYENNESNNSKLNSSYDNNDNDNDDDTEPLNLSTSRDDYNKTIFTEECLIYNPKGGKVNQINFSHKSSRVSQVSISYGYRKKYTFDNSHIDDNINQNNYNTTTMTHANVNNEKPLIIICDDSSIILESLEKVLLSIPSFREMYNIIKCYDGSTLLSNIIENQQFNKIALVITDENMGYMNGSDFLDILIKMKQNGKLNIDYPIISLTAFIDTSMINRLYTLGFSKVLNKPANKKIVYELLNEYGLIPKGK